MANERRMVSIAIGIGDAIPRKYLSGAVNSAKHFHNWAESTGYESVLLTDDSGSVTRDELRGALLKAINGDRGDAGAPHRLLLYFAGHGLIREAEEGLWLLSDWESEGYAVASEPLKRRLYKYGVKHIAIIADACRDLPSDMDQSDLDPDSILPKGPIHANQDPWIDRFTAAQDGESAFMIPGESPEEDRCLFSGVLMEGLWGLKDAAFSQYRPDLVTGGSLSKFLREEVPVVAARYNRDLQPSATAGFPEGEDVYFEKGKGVPPPFPAWPPPGNLLEMGTGRDRSISVGFAPGSHKTSMARKSRKPKLFAAGELGTLSTPHLRPNESAIQVKGGTVLQIRIPRHVQVAGGARDGRTGGATDRDWCEVKLDLPRFDFAGFENTFRPAVAIVEFEDGLGAAVPLIPRFITSIVRDESGVVGLAVRGSDIGGIHHGLAEALSRLEQGSLRSDDAPHLAVQLRHGKHDELVLGAISAYLYDAVGDTDNIRRMAYYYARRRQPIPYDVALLAMIPAHEVDGIYVADVPAVAEAQLRSGSERGPSWSWEATPAIRGVVGGAWPWLRQGWSFLDDPTGEELSLIRYDLPNVARYLKPGRFSTVDGDGIVELSFLFDLVAVEIGDGVLI